MTSHNLTQRPSVRTTTHGEAPASHQSTTPCSRAPPWQDEGRKSNAQALRTAQGTRAPGADRLPDASALGTSPTLHPHFNTFAFLPQHYAEISSPKTSNPAYVLERGPFWRETGRQGGGLEPTSQAAQCLLGKLGKLGGAGDTRDSPQNTCSGSGRSLQCWGGGPAPGAIP